MKRLFKIFFLWRVLLFLPLVVAPIILPNRVGYFYTVLSLFIHSKNQLLNIFLYPWGNFDGAIYLAIAGNGITHANARFFPLYPIFLGEISQFFGARQTYDAVQIAVSLVISNLFFATSLIIFYKLLKLDFSDKISLRSILFLLLFPTSFFFASIYSESLFFLLTVLSFYFVRRKNYLFAGISAGLLSATRLVGIFVLPALIYEFWLNEKIQLYNKKSKSRVSALLKSIPLLLSFFGIGFYAFYNYVYWNSAFYFFTSQGEVFNNRSVTGIIFFPQTLIRYVKIFISILPFQYEWWVAALEVAAFFFGIIFLYIAWKKKVRISYILFSLMAFFLPASSGTFAGLPRYIIVLFPIYIALALVENKAIRTIYIIVSTILLFILLMFFSRGYLIA